VTHWFLDRELPKPAEPAEPATPPAPESPVPAAA